MADSWSKFGGSRGFEPAAVRLWPSFDVGRESGQRSGADVKLGTSQQPPGSTRPSQSVLSSRNASGSYPYFTASEFWSASSSELKVPPVSYFADPEFVPFRHASSILENCSVSLPARDADAALAALDLVETQLRNERDNVRTSEERARDSLRAALQGCARARAAGVLDADQAEEALGRAEEIGKTASKELVGILAPLKTARERKQELSYAGDLVGVLARDERDLDALRAAEVLARAHEKLSVDETALAIFDNNEEALGKARRRIGHCIDDLMKLLKSTVSQGVATSDPSLIRLCALAGSRLGPEHESRIVMVTVESIIAGIGNGSGDMGPSASVTRGLARERRGVSNLIERSSEVCEDDVVEDALRPFLVSRVDAVDTACEFGKRAPSWFPHPSFACEYAVGQLASHYIVREGRRVLDQFEEDLRLATARVTGSGSERMDLIAGSHDGERFDSRRDLARARLRQLQVLAVVKYELRASKILLLAAFDGWDVPDASLERAYLNSVGGVESRTANYFELEKVHFREQVLIAFAAVQCPDRKQSALEGQEPESDLYWRFRKAMLHALAALPRAVARATRSCQLSVRRCALAFFDPGMPPGKSDPVSNSRKIFQTGVQEDAQKLSDTAGKVGAICGILLEEYLARADALVRGMSQLVDGASSGLRGNVWSNASISPLAGVCKAVKYLFDSGQLMESFFLSLECRLDFGSSRVAVDKMEKDPTRSSIDSMVDVAFGEDDRLRLRLALRSGLQNLATSVSSMMEEMLESFGERLRGILDVSDADFDYSRRLPNSHSPMANAVGYSGSLGDVWEPSWPIVSLCTFLEQHLGVVCAALPPENLDMTVRCIADVAYSSVLSRWCSLQCEVSMEGGHQISCDGAAVMHVLREVYSSPTCIDRLVSLGTVFTCQPEQLVRVLESMALSQIDRNALVALVGKRQDASESAVRSVREMWTSVAS